MNNIQFYYPMTLKNDGSTEQSVVVEFSGSLPTGLVSQSPLQAAVLTNDLGLNTSGLYTWYKSRWVLVMPYAALCEGIISGAKITVAINVPDTEFGDPTLYSTTQVYKQGTAFTDNGSTSKTDASPNVVWGVYQVPVVGSGAGTVKTVNNVGPDGSGNVALAISDIPGLTAALAAAGQVKTVSGQAPDTNGNIVIEAVDNNAASGSSLIADTGSSTGVIKLLRLVAGTNVTLGSDGNSNLVISTAPPVTSVNAKTGAVVIAATDITTGTFASAQLGATSGDNQVLITSATGVPTWVSTIPTANLPASILGAVDYQTTFIPGTSNLPGATTANKGWYYVTSAAGTYTPPGGTLLTFAAGDWIISDGFQWSTVSTQGAVTSVSGQTGAVIVQAVDNNNATGTTLISDSGATTATVKLKTLVAGALIALATDANGNVVISSTATAGAITAVNSEGTGTPLVDNNGTSGGIATLKSLAAGSNITITPAGDGKTLTITANQAITPATTSVIGGVIVGTGLSVIANGTLSLAAPTGVNLGGVKAGTGVTIAADGTISSSGVTSVSTLTGAVVVQATNNNAATGTSLISDSGATTANIKLKTLVAGTNVTLSADGNGNVVITATGGTPPVTSVSTQTGAVVVQATDTSTASGTSLISDSGSTTANIKIKRLVAGTGITLGADVNGNLQVNSTATGGVSSITAGTSGALTGAITLTAGQSISLSNTGNTVQISGTGVPEAPNDGTLYGRQNMNWTAIPDIGSAITSVTGQSGVGAVLLVESSPPANSAIIKSLIAGSNVTLTDNSGVITVTASIPGGTVATVNSVSPDSSGNVALTAASVNAVPIAGNVTMTGPLNMGSQELSGIATPVNPSDAVPYSFLQNMMINGGVIG